MPFKFKVFNQKNALISAQNKNFKQALIEKKYPIYEKNRNKNLLYENIRSIFVSYLEKEKNKPFSFF
jgi:hypothetical protein